MSRLISWVKRTPILRKYSEIANKYPLACSFGTGGALGGLADVICQVIVERCDEFDVRRCFAMTSFGAVYTGSLTTVIYGSYMKVLPQSVLSNPLKQGLACTALDNFIHVPFLYTPFFYIFTGFLRGKDWDETIKAFALSTSNSLRIVTDPGDISFRSSKNVPCQASLLVG